MKIKQLLIATLATLFILSSTAQVRIGGNTVAEQGAILDLSSTTYTGGLKLPNITITDLGKIPNTFTDVSVQGQDTNQSLKGLMVYNTTASTGIETGVYTWNGDNWVKSGDNTLTGTPADWVTTNGAIGDGTYESNFINVCPTTNVLITAKSGYTLSNVVNGSLSGNVVTFKTVGYETMLGSVTVTNNGKINVVYVTVNPCDCGINGVAVSQTIGTNLYLTHRYATGTNGAYQCWMVENLKEGDYNPNSNVLGATGRADINGYGGNGSTSSGGGPYALGARGYYYTWYQSQNACPSGWSLSTEDQYDKLFGLNGQTKVMGEADSTTSDGRWWHGTIAGETSIAGGFSLVSDAWYRWGIGGFWWASGDTGRVYYGGSSGWLDTSTEINFWYAVRCVKN